MQQKASEKENEKARIDVNLIWRTICKFNFWWTQRGLQCDGNWLFIYSSCKMMLKNFKRVKHSLHEYLHHHLALMFHARLCCKCEKVKSVSLMLPTLDILIISVCRVETFLADRPWQQKISFEISSHTKTQYTAATASENERRRVKLY